MDFTKKEEFAMKILQFIVVEENMRNGRNKYTVSGECYLPCGTTFPVIQKGKGCIGLGMVKSLYITQTTTEIEFDLSREISKEKKNAYYDLYRNVLSTSKTDDPYGDSDQIIPGAMMGRTKSRSESPRERGLSDMLNYDEYGF